MYSTHSHRKHSPRYRFVGLLSRPANPDEYSAIAHKLASEIDLDGWDDSSAQASRLMYVGSCSRDAEYEFYQQDGPPIDVDAVLASYPGGRWDDPSYWPESGETRKARTLAITKQGDPTTKGGVVGAFCRTYDVPAVIEKLLPGVYEPAGATRYTYLKGSTFGGLVVYDGGKFAYSNHSTDPCSGVLVNAFDMLRMHLYGTQDDGLPDSTASTKLPSYKAMLECAISDAEVKRTMARERLETARQVFDEIDDKWVDKLKFDKHKGGIEDSAENALLILRCDPNLRGLIRTNEFSYRVCISDNLPWRSIEQGQNWTDADDAGLRNYYSRVWSITTRAIIMDALAEVASCNRFHPVREMLDSAVWDGQERADSIFVRYLGAEDCQYVRLATRKTLLAAVARIYEPGIKYDEMLVLTGPQGIGKSTILAKLAGKYFNDSLTTMSGKEAYEQLQGAWILEIAELAAARKSDIESLKHFVSKQADTFRPAYGRNIVVCPRQCILIGTTNSDEFLQDLTGNRRFYPVACGVHAAAEDMFTALTAAEVGQIWAEMVQAYRSGESLLMSKEGAQMARQMQEAYTVESPMIGPIQDYLERLLPIEWQSMDLGARRLFLASDDPGDMQRTTVSNLEIWVEVFGGDIKQLTNAKAYEIKNAMSKIKGWGRKSESYSRDSLYGKQRAYIKVL